MASPSRGGPCRQCRNVLTQEFQPHAFYSSAQTKKGSSNFDLLAFLFDSLVDQVPTSTSSNNFFQSLLDILLLHSTTVYTHPQAYRHHSSTVTGGEWGFLHPHRVRVPPCSNRSPIHEYLECSFSTVYLASGRENLAFFTLRPCVCATSK